MGGTNSRRMDFEHNPDIIAILQYLARRLATCVISLYARFYHRSLSYRYVRRVWRSRVRCFPNLSLPTCVSLALCLSLPPSSDLAYNKTSKPVYRCRALDVVSLFFFFTNASYRRTRGPEKRDGPSKRLSRVSPSRSGTGDTSLCVHAVYATCH